MRVAHVITRMIVGGAQENTLSSVRGLAAKSGYDVSLVTGAETGAEGDLLAGIRGRGRENGFKIVTVPPLVRAIDPRHDAQALTWLTGWFREWRPEVVHTHSSKAGVVGRVAARRADVPVVVHTLHSLVFHPYQRPAVRAAYRQVKRALVPFTDHYVSVSDDIRERAIAAGIGRPEQHSTIRSGFDTTGFIRELMPHPDGRTFLGLPADRVVIGVVGRLFELKGHEDVLRAAVPLVRRHPDVLVALVGSGPLEHDLRKLVRELGLQEHVEFVGRLPPSEMPIAFSAFDVLAHASLREGLARVIPQAVLAAVPVVAYDLDGSREVVVDGRNGFLVPPRDVAALSDRLALLAGDEDLRYRLGGGGMEEILVDFSVEEMVRRLDELYRRLVAEKRESARMGATP